MPPLQGAAYIDKPFFLREEWLFYLVQKMPYSIEQPDKLPPNVQKLSAGLKKRWIAIFNSAIEQGKDESTAFKLANGVIKKANKAMTDAPNYHESGEPICCCATCEYSENSWCTRFMFLCALTNICDCWQPSDDVFETEDGMMKAGARHSAGDSKMVQTIHDHAVSLGAMCGEQKAVSESQDNLIENGNALKAIAETDTEYTVGNYIILFGNPAQRDLEGLASKRTNPDGSKGEYFTKSTNLESTYTQTGMLYIDWEHGNDDLSQDEVLGYVDWKSAQIDERGVFVNRVLNRRNKYVGWLKTLIDAGLVGTSSQAIESRVQKANDGAIIRWPLKRDTLTVSPMESRMLSENTIQALKSLAGEIPAIACLTIGIGDAATELEIKAKLSYVHSQLEA